MYKYTFIKQKYFIQERDQDPLIKTLDQYFKKNKCRIYCQTITTLFFLLLVIPSIVLQQDFIEVNILPNTGGTFRVKEQLESPISIELISSDSYLLLDVQLYLDGQRIDQFTIQENLQINSTYNITSNKPYKFTIRLMSQYSYVPTSYLIIQIVMFVISLLFLIQEIIRKKKKF